MHDAQANTEQPPSLPSLEALPSISCSLPEQEIRARMRALAKRGKLPNHQDGGPGTAFTSDLFGEPVDYTLLARVRAEGASSVIAFGAKIKPRTPAIFWLLTVLTVWPGMWMTDSMIRTYFTSYDFPTWIWYVPVMVLPLPWMWFRMMKKSKLAAADHATELLERIAAEVGGRVTP